VDAAGSPAFAGTVTALAAVAAGGFVRGFSGFGGTLVMAPILALTQGPAPAVAMLVCLETVGSIQLLPEVWRRARWAEIAPMGLAAAAMVPVGVAVLVHTEPYWMRRIISALVIVFALVLASGVRYRGPPGRGLAVGVGATSGFLSGSVGVGGPPVVVYLLGGPAPAAVVRRDLIAYNLFTNAVAIVSLGGAGVMDLDLLARLAVLAPVFALAVHAGMVAVRFADEHRLRRVSLALVLAAGIVGLVSGNGG